MSRVQRHQDQFSHMGVSRLCADSPYSASRRIEGEVHAGEQSVQRRVVEDGG